MVDLPESEEDCTEARLSEATDPAPAHTVADLACLTAADLDCPTAADLDCLTEADLDCPSAADLVCPTDTDQDLPMDPESLSDTDTDPESLSDMDPECLSDLLLWEADSPMAPPDTEAETVGPVLTAPGKCLVPGHLLTLVSVVQRNVNK